MIETFRKKAEEYLDSAVMLLSELISFPSIQSEAEDSAPFGRDCANVLRFAAETLEDEFVVKNHENYVITASFNDSPAEVGILCHLDVVPVAGQTWTSDPFTADIRNNRLYGRGAIDDKGPAAAVITAMRIIKDMGLPIKRNVRLILGSNEENSSKDIEYYLTKESFPPLLFTPDADFPVITAEKGMVRYEYSGAYGDEQLVSLTGGSVVNAVPERAEAVLKASLAEKAAQLINERNAADTGVRFSIKEENGLVTVTAVGKGAHASTPEQGCNALTALMSLLCELPVQGELAEMVRMLSAMYPFGETDGRSAGIAMSDDISGGLTSVLSVADCKDGRAVFLTDTRLPVTHKSCEVTDILDKNSRGTGKVLLRSEPHRADEKGELVQTLLSVYEECTGLKGRCLAIGGGTYVHDTENGVAFGAQWEDINNMHGADEFIGLEELKKDILIYTQTIYRLAVL